MAVIGVAAAVAGAGAIAIASTNSADSYESLSLLFIATTTADGGVNADVVNFATAVAISVADAESLITIF